MSLLIQLDLQEFLEFASYNKLFSYIVMPASMAKAVEEADKGKTIVYCEPFNEFITHVWYPIDSWIAECKRRKGIEEIEEENKKKRRMYVKPLREQLREALLDCDEEKVTEIMQKIKEENEAKSKLG